MGSCLCATIMWMCSFDRAVTLAGLLWPTVFYHLHVLRLLTARICSFYIYVCILFTPGTSNLFTVRSGRSYDRASGRAYGRVDVVLALAVLTGHAASHLVPSAPAGETGRGQSKRHSWGGASAT